MKSIALGRRSLAVVALLATALLSATIALHWHDGHRASADVSRAAVKTAEISRVEPPDQPHHVISAEHELKRIKHKDATGAAPLELVNTPEGIVTIRRTFDDKGVLLREEAYFAGKHVPLPKS